jgi:hypothetical protein
MMPSALQATRRAKKRARRSLNSVLTAKNRVEKLATHNADCLSLILGLVLKEARFNRAG